MSSPSSSGRGVLDTSVVILLPRIIRAGCLPDEPVITTATLAELAAGPHVAGDDAERARRQAQVQLAESTFVALPFDEAAARAFGPVAASLRRSGRKRSARAFDALIAAIAVANGLAVHTANPSDFEGIDGLEVVPLTDADLEA